MFYFYWFLFKTENHLKSDFFIETFIYRLMKTKQFEKFEEIRSEKKPLIEEHQHIKI